AALIELSPTYLETVPPDLFSGEPLKYRVERDGYILYSVGSDGIDDGGQSHDDEPPGDDLVIRMPVAAPPAKKN
ncbi:MAG: hypothetical protein ACJ8F7_19190, partial [Gemmataceae bacterium]